MSEEQEETPPPPPATPPPPRRRSLMASLDSPLAMMSTGSSTRRRKSVLRVSTSQDISTGKSGAITDMTVEVLEDSSREPMDPKERRKKEFRNTLKNLGNPKNRLKLAAEQVIADNRLEHDLQEGLSNDSDEEDTQAKRTTPNLNLLRNATQQVVARNRLFHVFHREQQEPRVHHLHGRLSVEESQHGGGDLNESCSSSGGSSSSSSGPEPWDLEATEPTVRKKSKKRKNHPHYRLALHKGPRGNVCVQCLRMIGISAGSDGIYDSTGGSGGCKCFGLAPNRLVTSYLHWTFRTSFSTYFLSAALSYFALTIVFALIIWASGENKPECIHVNGEDFGTERPWGDFLDAYALSWTTFSTVGYGLIFPSTSVVVDNHRQCGGISALTTLESYVGILFASFTGAIVFSKITRIRSQAQVLFSDPLVIKYGQGVMGSDGEDASSTNESGGKQKRQSIINSPLDNHFSQYSPFPVLEFRIVNRLHSELKGEIMDCVMNVVASIDARNADPSIQRMAGHQRRRKGKRRGARRPMAPPTGVSGTIPRAALNMPDLHHPTIEETKELEDRDLNRSGSNVSTASGKSGSRGLSSDAAVEQVVIRKRKHTAFDEEIGGNLVPRRIFSKLEIDGGPDHPFFKRVWIARHILDLHSPLLTMEARNRIRLNGGRWPVEYNNHDAVRRAVSFDQILVSFSGTSNVDANSVYAQKVYEYGDVNVGYTFVSMLYRDLRDGSLKCDLTLLNDVFEQAGGGGEPLQGLEQRDFTDNLSGIVVL